MILMKKIYKGTVEKNGEILSEIIIKDRTKSDARNIIANEKLQVAHELGYRTLAEYDTLQTRLKAIETIYY